MVAQLFNGLITALDILPNSSKVDFCVHHSQTCVLSGKIRIIAKRPCQYKSLELTAKGVARVERRQGPKTVRAKQVFLNASKTIVRDPAQSPASSPRTNETPQHLSFELETHLESPPYVFSESEPDQWAVPGSAPAAAEAGAGAGAGAEEHISSDSLESTTQTLASDLEQQQQQQQQQQDLVSTPPSTPTTYAPRPTETTINQLVKGVNDIDFSIEFPSHIFNIDPDHPPSLDPVPIPLPSGPMKTLAVDSTILYTLRATLVMSRRDILVNNRITVAVPFEVQAWQDPIDWRQSEDHSYHGKRRGKIDFQFHVPKQLDLRRLQELQFGFEGKWRTHQDHLKVKEVEYYIVEDELQRFELKVPVVTSSIISTAVTHRCAPEDSAPTNAWHRFPAPERLQILQPSTILETAAIPWPNILSVSYKLRILIRFDQTQSKERDLQLSFPIQIHPTLGEDNVPVLCNLQQRHHALYRQFRQRTSRGRAYFGDGFMSPHRDDAGLHGSDEDDEDDENVEGILPLPMYADREASVLLMVGDEVQETDAETADILDSLGMGSPLGPSSMTMVSPLETLIRFPSSEGSMTLSAPNSPASPSAPSFMSSVTGATFSSGPGHETNHRRSSYQDRGVSMSEPRIEVPRRHSSFPQPRGMFSPPPYGAIAASTMAQRRGHGLEPPLEETTEHSLSFPTEPALSTLGVLSRTTLASA